MAFIMNIAIKEKTCGHHDRYALDSYNSPCRVASLVFQSLLVLTVNGFSNPTRLGFLKLSESKTEKVVCFIVAFNL